MSHIQYAPFSSAVDPGFWQILTEKKLNEFGLDESHQTINGFYSNGNAQGIPPQMTVDYAAFNREWKPPPRSFPVCGTLCNTNTIEKFREMDKKQLLSGVGQELWEDITSGKVLEHPEKLCRFVLLTFSDLKKYHYYYWFAFPALKFPEKSVYSEPPRALQEVLPPEKLSALAEAYDSYQSSRSTYATFFVVSDDGNGPIIADFKELDKLVSSPENVMVGVCDPSAVQGYPGWPVRNLLSFLTYRYTGKVQSIKVLMVRDRTHDGVRDFGQSVVASIAIPALEKEDILILPECVGWEKNERSKMGPRMVNLSSSMDPTRLAESAVDLNLRLMRWRLLPDLELDKIGSTRCLVLGSGTLGCNVARLLMSWGIRHITMVDNSKVSYSNPVRQTLFTFQDCINGGQPKAKAAAASLRNIFPGMQSEGISLSIPMPGHAITDSVLEQTKEDVKKLESLIDAHDAVFLLMDTRESRWLPTVVAAAKRKIVINAALGFDTFLVLRHGVRADDGPRKREGASAIPLGRIRGCELGCYFCNDVVAPGNSTRDRTLDQQCTVTRPGISMVASALAVELLVSVLQHPLGSDAEADTSANEDHLVRDAECSLGIVPHQIRGFLARFHQILPASRAFDMCTACSDVVLNKYKTEGFDFLLRAFNEPGFLEDLTGLTAMQDATDDAEVWGLSDDEEFSSGPGSMDMDT
ncbi:ubiquitin-like modifier-activating enzyme ATG7 [Aplysia californica]|uniref:Ubiquitin-like modifier-activating enzyme ATG7 n=1 Tax=Aplysia californica TaxID=6500 RepID=A0ABM1W3B8_APLCA|nr:ubiquitin-like modifier-activating enzyme ATG7 [Aplysia californica]